MGITEANRLGKDPGTINLRVTVAGEAPLLMGYLKFRELQDDSDYDGDWTNYGLLMAVARLAVGESLQSDDVLLGGGFRGAAGIERVP